MLGFSAGVMIAASFWSLLIPSLDLSEQLGYIEWVLPAIGFAVGGLFVKLKSLLSNIYAYTNDSKSSDSHK